LTNAQFFLSVGAVGSVYQNKVFTKRKVFVVVVVVVVVVVAYKATSIFFTSSRLHKKIRIIFSFI
jgi:hypothetical protein